MDLTPEAVSTGAELTAALARNTATYVADKVQALRAKHNDTETINGLEQLINDLIADKTEIARIAHVYQAELVAQRLAPGDLKYITDNVVPLIKKLVEASGGEGAAQLDQLVDLLTPLLSMETANILQILGFDFRQAVGQPLTQLVKNAITSKAPGNADSTAELQRLEAQRQTALYNLALDEAATNRLRSLIGS